MKVIGKGGQKKFYDVRKISLCGEFWCYINYRKANSVALII